MIMLTHWNLFYLYYKENFFFFFLQFFWAADYHLAIVTLSTKACMVPFLGLLRISPFLSRE